MIDSQRRQPAAAVANRSAAKCWCGWMCCLLMVAGSSANCPALCGQEPSQETQARPEGLKYLPAKAHYILPETHNNQSGYFSLCEGLDGSVYVGTTRYGENSHLVEFDPHRQSQQVVIDTHKLCGLTATGYAAQAKIHTRNFVGRSGKIYVGSKQGYRMDESDTADYPGGYVMVYDPRTGSAENLGMPLAGQGVIDVAADEARGLIYVVTCEDQHWMIGDLAGANYRELGPLLTPYASTLIDAGGRAHAITHDFQLASYDPATDKISIRPIQIDGTTWTRADDHSIPTWVLAGDAKRAYLILLNDPTLLEIDLAENGATVTAVSHGEMVQGNHPDSRCGLDLGADGNVYAIVRTDNETGFGSGYLHHIARFVTASGTMEDLGVLTVENPDYFDWEATGPDGKRLPWTHGFHRLPDDTLTPLHAHMALMATADNTLYVTVIYPFTLLRLDQFRIERPVGAAERMMDWALELTRRAEQNLAAYTEVAEIMAERHERGGLIGFPFEQQALAQDLWGRSGGMIHIGFSRPWTDKRTPQQQSFDVGIVGYDRPPDTGHLETLRQFKQRGGYLVGFGPQRHDSLREIVAICDAWFDTGFGHQDLVVPTNNSGNPAGHGNVVANAIHGATLIAEVVGALTRRGRMPTMWKGYAYEDGRAWGDKYFGKLQFHDDFTVQPLAAGQLGARFLKQIRYPIRRLRAQSTQLRATAQLLTDEIAADRNVFVVWQGHMPPTYIGQRSTDADWAIAVELHPFLPQQVDQYRDKVPDGALVLSLGYHGLDPIQANVWREKKHRVIHLCGGHPSVEWQPGPEWLQRIDLGFAFGDACVTLEGYPIRLFAPSGIAQSLAYEAILAEMSIE